MNTMFRMGLASVFAVGLAVGAAGCDQNKCEEAMENSIELSAEAEEGMEVAEMPDDMMDQMVQGCEEALNAGAEGLEEALDCMAGADSVDDLAECDSMAEFGDF